MTGALRLPCAALYRYLVILTLISVCNGINPCAVGSPHQYSTWLGPGGELTFPITKRYAHPFDEDVEKHFYNPSEFIDDYLMLHSCPDEDFNIIEENGSGCTHCKAAHIYSCYGQNQTDIILPDILQRSELCVFRMNFVGVENVQSNSFSGLTIKNIKIQFGGVKHIEPKAFNNVTRLLTLTITQNQIVHLGKPREVFACLPELHVLILDQNQIRSWDSDDFVTNDTLLPNLEYLSLAGNPFNALNRTSFSWLRGAPLKYLNLRESKVCTSTTPLGKNILEPVKKTLEFLDLGSATMGVNALSVLLQSLVYKNGSTRLKGLGLSNLGLNIIPPALQLVKKNLQYLSLHGNSFHEIKGVMGSHTSQDMDGHLFEDRSVNFPSLPELIELDLRDSQIKCIRYGAFEMLPKLQVLMLGSNELSYFEDGTFRNLNRVHYLDLSHNIHYQFSPPLFGYIYQPTSLYLDDMPSLRTLDLSYSKIDMLRVDSLYGLGASLVNLSLCYVEMSRIDEGVFRNLSGLEILDLSGNSQISSVFTPELFAGLDNLRELHMADCNLDFPQVSAEPVILLEKNFTGVDPFLHFTKLKVLNITHNNIKSITQNTFSSLKSVETIDIGENHVLPWTHPILSHNKNLTKLNVRRNRISFMTETMLREFSMLDVVDVSGNPFMCDCYIIPFLNIASNNLSDENPTSTEAQTMLIQKSVPFFTYRNSSWDRQIPPSDQEEKWEVLIQTALSRNIDNILKNNRFYYEEKARSFLDLGEDQQGMLKRHFLELNVSNLVNRSVYVVGLEQDNAYNCLDTQWSLNFEFHDVNDSYCMVKKSSTLPPNNDTTVYIAILLIILLTIVLFFFVLYRKWWYIRYYALQLKNATILSFMGRCNEEEPQPIFQYDVFLSFCDVNREWVLEHLIPNLEGENDLHVCLHERDFQVGVSILENIIASMDRSRCILLVVSLSFIKSRWCQFELHVAQHRLLETRREELVLILLEDIPRSKRPKMLHYLMLTKTYIVWPKDGNNVEARKLFWKRLKKAVVPNRNNMVSVV